MRSINVGVPIICLQAHLICSVFFFSNSDFNQEVNFKLVCFFSHMGCLLYIYIYIYIIVVSISRASEGWGLSGGSFSHGPEPTEQTLRESKENTATKSQWSAAVGLKKEKKKKKRKERKWWKEKSSILLQPNMHYGKDTSEAAPRVYTTASWQADRRTAADVDSHLYD